MKKSKKQKLVNYTDLNPVQQQYIEDVLFLQRLSKTGFGKVPTNLFDGLYKAIYLDDKNE